MLKQIEKSFLNYFSYFPEKTGKIDCYKSTKIFDSSYDVTQLNIAHGIEDLIYKSDFDNLISKFEGRGFSIMIPNSELSDINIKHLNKMNFFHDTERKTFVIEVNNFTDRAYKTNLDIIEAKSKEHIYHFANMIKSYNKEISDYFLLIEPQMLSEKQKILLGYYNDIPVVGAIVNISNDIVGIFRLTVDKFHTNMGFGRDMVRYVLNKADEELFKYSVSLSNSKDGDRIMNLMGYKQFNSFEFYKYQNSI